MVDGEDHVHDRPDGDDVAVRASRRTTGRLVIASIVRMATSGTLMIGIVRLEPNQPVLSIVNVLPPKSSRRSLPARARAGDVGDRPVQAADRELVDVADDRHQQAVVDRDRDAHVDAPLGEDALRRSSGR